MNFDHLIASTGMAIYSGGSQKGGFFPCGDVANLYNKTIFFRVFIYGYGFFVNLDLRL